MNATDTIQNEQERQKEFVDQYNHKKAGEQNILNLPDKNKSTAKEQSLKKHDKQSFEQQKLPIAKHDKQQPQ